MTRPLSAAVALLALLGCQKSEDTNVPPRATVKVSVTVDGQPLPMGRITFQVNGQAPGLGEVKDGQARFLAPVGKCHVEIVGLREVPNRDPQEYLPARYNMESKLTAEVFPEKENTFDFKVTSK